MHPAFRAAPAGALFAALAVSAACKRLWLEADGGPIAGSGPHAKYGFVTQEKDGRLWVFRWGSKELKDYRSKGELAKHVTLVGSGPNGMTLKVPDVETANDYLYGKPGFVAWADKDGRLWVFKRDSKELQDYYAKGELAKHVTRIGAGPKSMTVKAPDTATVDAYLAAKESPA